MNRRRFLGNMLSAGALPVVLNGMPLHTLADSPFLKALSSSSSACEGRVLVLIQLNGGNDGLNTIVPLDQYANLLKARSNVILPEDKVLKLPGRESLGLHPAMQGIHNMYKDGIVSIVQSVGYPNQDFSHFRSTDIWLSASDADVSLSTGWMGRYLDGTAPGFPIGYPNAQFPDPLAIQVGAVVSPALHGPDGTTAMAINDIDSFYQLVTDTDPTNKDTPTGHELSFLRQTALQTNAYAERIKLAAERATNLSTLYPDKNSLADQLKIVAQLVAGGLQTKVYMVNLGGFDTHAAQVDITDNTIGDHATLLKKVSEAVFAFQDDLKLLAVDDRVLGVSFSEFGRRIKSNGSDGTDHGAAAPLFMFGQSFLNKVIGANPTIANVVGAADNVPMQYDFRSVYASILKDWFCVDDAIIRDVLQGDHDYLPLNTGINDYDKQSLLEAYPNPTNSIVTLTWPAMLGNNGEIELYNSLGVRVQNFKLSNNPNNQFAIDLSAYAQGNYFIRMKIGGTLQTTNLLKINQ